MKKLLLVTALLMLSISAGCSCCGWCHHKEPPCGQACGGASCPTCAGTCEGPAMMPGPGEYSAPPVAH